jgi:hypothetical protein
VAEITLVKGETSALDRTWMSMPDGSTRQVAVHVVHDLSHLVVESMFGIEVAGVAAAACGRAWRRSRTVTSRLGRERIIAGLGLTWRVSCGWM